MRRNSSSPKRSSWMRSTPRTLPSLAATTARGSSGTSRSGSRKNAATGAAASAGTSHAFDLGRAALSRAAAPSAMPAAATPLESMFIPRKSGTLEGGSAGQSLARRRVGAGV